MEVIAHDSRILQSSQWEIPNLGDCKHPQFLKKIVCSEWQICFFPKVLFPMILNPHVVFEVPKGAVKPTSMDLQRTY
jgi:hypothetical protein